MKKLIVLLSASVAALALSASALAWHADGVNVSATCDTKTGTYSVSADIVQNAKYPATLSSITPGTFAGTTSGTKPVVVVVKFTNGETQTWNKTVILDGACVVPAVVVTQALHLRKTVTNDGGGTAAATAWTLTATGMGASPTSFSGSTPADSGAGFQADTYTLAEAGGPTGYTAGAWGCVLTGQATTVAVTDSKVVVGAGQDVTCTINNTYVAPVITPTVTPTSVPTPIPDPTPIVTPTVTPAVVQNVAAPAATGSFMPPTVKTKSRAKAKHVAPVCVMVAVAPKVLKANGKLQAIHLKVTRGLKGLAGVPVRITGLGISMTVKSGRGGIGFARVSATRPGIVTVKIARAKACGTKRLGMTGSYEPTLTG